MLLIEDDNQVADALMLALKASDYLVDRVCDGASAEIFASTNPYDVFILDLGLPDMNGIDVLRRIRKKNISTPVVILTAKDSYEERIEGLNSGANDYVVKPFHFGELEARIRAVLRTSCRNATHISVGELVFDSVGRVLRKGEQIIELSPRELSVLEILLINIGSLVSKQRLSSQLSDWDEPVTYNAIDIIVYRLRKKLEPYGLKLQTIRGLGFLAE